MPLWKNANAANSAPKFITNARSGETGVDEFGTQMFYVRGTEGYPVSPGWARRTIKGSRTLWESLVTFSNIAEILYDPETLFDHTANVGMAPAADGGVYTLGVVLKFAVGGYVSKVHIYHAGNDSPPSRSAGVWSSSGILLGTGTLTGEVNGPGWKDIVLDAPVYVAANTAIVAGVTVTTPNSYSAQGDRFFAAPVTNGNVIALQSNDGAAYPGNGRFYAGAGLNLPVQSFNEANYWVDVTFTQGNAPSLPSGFPNATNTGPTGGLTPFTGTYYSTGNGHIIENMDITGMIFVDHANVIIRNCRINSTTPYHAIHLDYQNGGSNLTVEDTKIIGNGTTVNGILGSGTFKRNDISGVENGIGCSSNTLIEDNYIHDMANVGEPHYDGIEVNGGTNITIRHNTVFHTASQTSAIMFNNYFSGLSNILVEDNLLGGGGYTVYVDDTQGVGVVDGASIIFQNNKMVPGTNNYFALYTSGAVTTGNRNAYTNLLI